MRKTLFLLSAASFVVLGVMTVTGPLLPLMATEFSRTVGQVGIVVTAFVVPYGAFQILFGPLGDRIGKLKVVGIALGLSSIPTLYCGLVTSLDGLILMRFLTGIAMAGTVPLAMAFLADEIPFAERQPVMGRYVNGLVLGQIVGGSLGGVAAEYFAWRHIFIVFAALSAAISLCLLWEAHQRPAPKHLVGRPVVPVFSTYVTLLRQRRSRDIIVIGTVEGLLIFGILAYFGAYLRQAHGYNYALIGALLGMYGVGGLIYAAAVYRLVRRLGERRMVLIGSSLLGICCVLLCAVPQWWLLGPLFTVAGFGFYMFHNTMQTRASELSDEARGTAVSLWVFMLFAGQGIGVVLFGAIIDHVGYTSAFIAAGAGIVVLGWWTTRLLVRHG